MKMKFNSKKKKRKSYPYLKISKFGKKNPVFEFIIFFVPCNKKDHRMRKKNRILQKQKKKKNRLLQEKKRH